jgi:hypothetical protein
MGICPLNMHSLKLELLQESTSGALLETCLVVGFTGDRPQPRHGRSRRTHSVEPLRQDDFINRSFPGKAGGFQEQGIDATLSSCSRLNQCFPETVIAANTAMTTVHGVACCKIS